MSLPKNKLTKRDYCIGAGIILAAAAGTGGFGYLLVVLGG